MLLTSLNPAAIAGGADIGDAVRIDGAVLSRSDLVGAATSVAERVAAADLVAVLATPTATTVLGKRCTVLARICAGTRDLVTEITRWDGIRWLSGWIK